MITNPIELATQRRLTATFIAADPETITLIPRVSQKTSGGGREWVEQTPREPQEFKIVERVTGARSNTRVAGGEQREEEFQLIGEWDAQVEARDIFVHRGREWEVAQVEWDNGYEKRASVVAYGR